MQQTLSKNGVASPCCAPRQTAGSNRPGAAHHAAAPAAERAPCCHRRRDHGRNGGGGRLVEQRASAPANARSAVAAVQDRFRRILPFGGLVNKLRKRIRLERARPNSASFCFTATASRMTCLPLAPPPGSEPAVAHAPRRQRNPRAWHDCNGWKSVAAG